MHEQGRMMEPSPLIFQQDVTDALELSHQLSRHHLVELRRLDNIIIFSHDHANGTIPKREGSLLTSSLERNASSSLLNSAIQGVHCLEQYLESIIHYSWEEDDDDDNYINENEEEEEDTRINGDAASSLKRQQQQQTSDHVLHSIVILREYIARCSFQSKFSNEEFGGGDGKKNDSDRNTFCFPNNDSYDNYDGDGDGDDGDDDRVKEKHWCIGERFLDWAIAAKYAGLMEDCIRAHICRMNIEPIWKQLDAVRLLGMVDNHDVRGIIVGSGGDVGCNMMIEIEEIPTKGIFESVPHQLLRNKLPTQKPSKNAIQLGMSVHQVFHSAGYNYWSCMTMLRDVLSSSDDERMTTSRCRIYSANSFFQHRHEIYHALYEAKSEGKSAGNEEPWKVLACLFLFGISLKRIEVSSSIGEENISTLFDARLLRNNLADTTYLVSEVQIYPLDTSIFECIKEEKASLSSTVVYCMTDWGMESLRSPRNAVMTVGYDSLELLALSCAKDIFEPTNGGCKTTRVLDLCCGCGIQGIFTAKRSYSWSHPSVLTEIIAMDINVRAVRFAMANACLNGLFACDEDTTSFMYSAIEADVFEPVGNIPVNRLSRQIGLFDYIMCNPPFVAIPMVKNMTVVAPALYAVGGGFDGMKILRRILKKCFDFLDVGIHRQLLMVTELPNIETSCDLLSSMLPYTARVNVAYIEDDVETIHHYAKEREVEAGFDIATRDWSPPLNQITNRALALISISRAFTPALNLFCFRTELDSAKIPHNSTTDEEDLFLTKEGLNFVRRNLL
jgi:hypothetical protein